MQTNAGLESDPQGQEAQPDDLPAGINVEELAKKVFELLLQELEIENDRTGKY